MHEALMNALIGSCGGLQQPSHCNGEEVRRAPHNLIKTTVDRVCGNELERQSHGSVKQEPGPVKEDIR